ncbi:hypothetical protein [Oceanobacillus senegalensis]|uniref:hypothetical protein n=1 Tax=Oceanobacillus senegalensis TaxID=1936063 RepID=UPI0015C4C517|nr:hypothetical protein [Oceanobacillus senegalensis]
MPLWYKLWIKENPTDGRFTLDFVVFSWQWKDEVESNADKKRNVYIEKEHPL